MKLKYSIYFIYSKHLFSQFIWRFRSEKKRSERKEKRKEFVKMSLENLAKSHKLTNRGI